MPDRGPLKVFVSSTSDDLDVYRIVASAVISALGWQPEMMENWTASSRPTLEACLNKLEGCDLVLLLVAFRRGWVPTAGQRDDGQDSITRLEWLHARRKRIPVLALLAKDNWPGHLWDRAPEDFKEIESFRADLKNDRPVGSFEHEKPENATRPADLLPKFSTLVRQTLLEYKQELMEAGAVTGTYGPDFFGSAWEGLRSGRTIPFVGMGIYGSGPLSSAALSRALARDQPLQERSLATVAEYREGLEGTRHEFLRRFQEILDQQTPLVERNAIHDLLASLQVVPDLIVDATFDDTLERRLAAAGKPYTVFTHIIRSDGVDAGWFLVMRPGHPPLIQSCETFTMAKGEHVIYRPLGLPSFNQKYNETHPDRDIDTVVVTESDHIALLRLLSTASGLPLAVKPLLMINPILFVGYGLDVWQYRLVAQMFATLRNPKKTATRAVGKPPAGVERFAAELENLAWGQLGVQVIPMDPAEFARRAEQDRLRPARESGLASI